MEKLTDYEIHLIIKLIEDNIGILDSTLSAFENNSDLKNYIYSIRNLKNKKEEYETILEKFKEEV